MSFSFSPQCLVFFFFRLVIILFSTPTPSWPHFLSICYPFNSRFFANGPSILPAPSNTSDTRSVHLCKEVSLEPPDLQVGASCPLWYTAVMLRCPFIIWEIHLFLPRAGFVSWVLCLVLPRLTTHTHLCKHTHPLWCSTALRKGVWEVENFQLPITENGFVLSAPLMIVWLGREF